MKGHPSVCLGFLGFVFFPLILEGKEKETWEKLWNGERKGGKSLQGEMLK